jgi:opacity protein-like surface antigen
VKRNASWVLAVCLALAVPSAARADVLLSPFAGLTFVDGESKRTFGASLGFGSIITMEADVSRTSLGSVETPGFDLDVRSTSYMGNVLIRPPFGSVQPYGLAGIGIIRLSGRFELPFEGNLGDATETKLGYALGGGVFIFFSPNLGLRGDVRYIRPFGDLRVSDLVDLPTSGDVPAGQLDMTRATVGLTLKF